MDHREIPERVQALKQEIDHHLLQLNELYWHGNLPSELANPFRMTSRIPENSCGVPSGTARAIFVSSQL